MTNEQILGKAIAKANQNGYNSTGWEFKCDNIDDLLKSKIYFVLILSHDFAKAIWGEKKKFAVSSYGCTDENNEENEPSYDGKNEYDNSLIYRIPAWQFHLQQMVLLSDDEKFKYLEKFL